MRNNKKYEIEKKKKKIGPKFCEELFKKNSLK